MPVIYRKYRPRIFAELIGQEHIKTILAGQVIKGKLGHAYLFTGPRGVGKTSTARILARSINCEKRQESSGEPCLECPSCQEVSSGHSLDVIEIDAASHTGVDTVRETIIDTARFLPSRLKYRVFIIDEVHMLSMAAWNALLKILEEPPAHMIFVLATTEAHKIPLTIISRCQRFDFKRIKISDIVERLRSIATSEKIKIASVVFTSIARLSEGCVRDAESLLEQLLALGEDEISQEEASLLLPTSSVPNAMELLKLFFESNAKEAVEVINRFFENGVDLEQLCLDVIEILRKTILLKVGNSKIARADLDPEVFKDLEDFIEKNSLSRILVMLEILLARVGEFKFTVIPQLPLELAAIEICGEGALRQPKEPRTVVAETTKKAQNNERNADITVIKAKWEETIRKVGELNYALPFILQFSEPMSLEGEVLSIGVRYPLHCNKLNEDKNRRLLAEFLSRQFGIKLMVEGVLMTRGKQGLVDEIINTFGGKMIE